MADGCCSPYATARVCSDGQHYVAKTASHVAHKRAVCGLRPWFAGCCRYHPEKRSQWAKEVQDLRRDVDELRREYNNRK